MDNIKKKIKEHVDSLSITAIAVLLILLIDFLGIFHENTARYVEQHTELLESDVAREVPADGTTGTLRAAAVAAALLEEEHRRRHCTPRIGVSGSNSLSAWRAAVGPWGGEPR